MQRRKLFISYARQDRDFVPLAARMLELHGHDVWFAREQTRDGESTNQKIENELAAADALIVVASRNAPGSTWIRNELARFRALKPIAEVVPVLLDRVDLKSIGSGLASSRAVDFTGDQLTGFQNLLAAFGHDFLSRRALTDRRTGSDRRVSDDRRESNASDRLSLGVLLSYTRARQGDVAEATTMSPGDLEMLREPLADELERHEYRETGGGLAVDPACVVDSAMAYAHTWLQSHRGGNTVEVLRVMAEFVCDRYELSGIERREGDRRSNDSSN
jgi:hypothetical protein